MPVNHRGVFTPRLPDTLTALLPDPLRIEWDAVLDAYARHQQANRDAATAQTAADTAPANDAAAAREAVRAGKAIPPETATEAARVAAVKQREVTALAQIAAELEAEFMDALFDARTVIGDAARAPLAAAVTAATDALHACEQPLNDVAALTGVIAWAGHDRPILPAARRLTATFNGVEQEVDALLGVAARTLAAQHPDAIDQRQAERDAEWQAARGLPQTPDGVVLVRSERGY